MPVPKFLVINPGNTQIIPLQGLQDSVTLSWINNATLTATLYDPNGQLDAVFGSIPLTYVAVSNGNYNGTIPATFKPATGGGYKLFLDGTDASGNVLHMEIPIVILVRVG